MPIQLTDEEEGQGDYEEAKLKSWVKLSYTKGIKRKVVSTSKLDKEMTRRVCSEAKHIAKICAEIYSRTGPVKHARWDRPDKNISINSFLDKSGKNKICNSYLPAMEHTFDILTLYFRLLVKYLHQIPAVDEYFTAVRLVKQTNTNLALRTLACMLWSRIQYVQEILNKVEIENKMYVTGSTNTSTQTETVSLTSCENCHTSKSLIKQLVENVENICDKYEFKNSHVMEIKNLMATDVFYLSQWAAITKWCDAIGKDFQLLSNFAYETVKINTTLHKEMKSLKEDYQKKMSVKQIDDKETSTERSKLLLEDDSHKRKISEYENLVITLRKELKEEKLKNLEFKEKCVNLSREINTKKLKIDYLEAELGNLKEESDKKIFRLRDDVAIKDVTVVSLNKKVEELEEKMQTYKNEQIALTKKIDAQQKYETELWKNYKTVAEENNTLKEQMNQNSEEMNLVMSRLQELKKQLTNKNALRVAITGNPLKDMEAQKMFNEARMLVLQEENKDLTKTIIRLYAQDAAAEAVSGVKRALIESEHISKCI